jgi:transcriptional regulator with XRE-family HTH domain
VAVMKKVDGSSRNGSRGSTTAGGDAARKAVAANVRAGRIALGWALDELAARCGVSKGMLVAVEQGRTNPSIQTLARVADSLGVTLARLVVSEVPASRIALSRKGARLWHTTRGSSATFLVGAESPPDLEFWEWVIKPGDSYSGQAELPGSLEIVFVHEGTLTLEVGDESATLEAGDSALIRPDVRRLFSNLSQGILRYGQAYALAPPADPGPLQRAPSLRKR